MVKSADTLRRTRTERRRNLWRWGVVLALSAVVAALQPALGQEQEKKEEAPAAEKTETAPAGEKTEAAPTEKPGEEKPAEGAGKALPAGGPLFLTPQHVLMLPVRCQAEQVGVAPVGAMGGERPGLILVPAASLQGAAGVQRLAYLVGYVIREMMQDTDKVRIETLHKFNPTFRQAAEVPPAPLKEDLKAAVESPTVQNCLKVAQATGFSCILEVVVEDYKMTTTPPGIEISLSGNLYEPLEAQPVKTALSPGKSLPRQPGDYAPPLRMEAEAIRSACWDFVNQLMDLAAMEAEKAPKLPPALVKVTSDPPGAQVLLYGKDAGTTPVDVTVERVFYKPRVYRFVLRKAGYFPRVVRVKLTSGKEVTLDAVLKPKPTRRVSAQPAAERVPTEAAPTTPGPAAVQQPTPKVKVEKPYESWQPPEGLTDQPIAIVPYVAPGARYLGLEEQPAQLEGFIHYEAAAGLKAKGFQSIIPRAQLLRAVEAQAVDLQGKRPPDAEALSKLSGDLGVSAMLLITLEGIESRSQTAADLHRRVRVRAKLVSYDSASHQVVFEATTTADSDAPVKVLHDPGQVSLVHRAISYALTQLLTRFLTKSSAAPAP